ncbi:MAG: molybdate ABC transporter permease subunit [Selenomonadales bacterium]|nr:molybdate ABC transporter permease subunit [Selenomonadales bacterium]
MDVSPLIISFKTAAVSSFIIFFVSIALAFAVVRMKRFKALADAVITLPMVLPPAAMGFLLLLLFGRKGLDLNIVFSWSATVVSAVAVSCPLMYKTVRASFEQLDADVLDAARSLGVSERRIFFYIMLPCAKFGIIAGLILAFTRSLGEFGATIILAGNIPGQTQTMSTAIYSAIQANDFEQAVYWTAALIVFSVFFVIAMNCCVYSINRRK